MYPILTLITQLAAKHSNVNIQFLMTPGQNMFFLKFPCPWAKWLLYHMAVYQSYNRIVRSET